MRLIADTRGTHTQVSRKEHVSRDDGDDGVNACKLVARVRGTDRRAGLRVAVTLLRYFERRLLRPRFQRPGVGAPRPRVRTRHFGSAAACFLPGAAWGSPPHTRVHPARWSLAGLPYARGPRWLLKSETLPRDEKKLAIRTHAKDGFGFGNSILRILKVRNR